MILLWLCASIWFYHFLDWTQLSNSLLHHCITVSLHPPPMHEASASGGHVTVSLHLERSEIEFTKSRPFGIPRGTIRELHPPPKLRPVLPEGTSLYHCITVSLCHCITKKKVEFQTFRACRWRGLPVLTFLLFRGGYGHKSGGA